MNWQVQNDTFNTLRKGIKFSMQKVYFRKVIFNVDP